MPTSSNDSAARKFYAEYQKAFGEATKLPLALRPWQNEVFPVWDAFNLDSAYPI
jgi:hypothetical protein